MDTKDTTRAPQLVEAPEIVVSGAPDRPAADRPVIAHVPNRCRGRARPVPAAPRRAAGPRAGPGPRRRGWRLAGARRCRRRRRRHRPRPRPTGRLPTGRRSSRRSPCRSTPPRRSQAGQPAELVVHYQDGKGTFSGSTEDWGDGVGTSSLAQGRCTAAGPPADPTNGSYRATHTWAEPGSYTVSIGVSSYTCVDGAAVEEQASTTVTVVVSPLGLRPGRRLGEPERLRRRAERGARAPRQVEVAELERLVAQRRDRPALIGAEPGDRDPVDRDLVAGRGAVGDLDGADELGAARGPRSSPRTGRSGSTATARTARRRRSARRGGRARPAQRGLTPRG